MPVLPLSPLRFSPDEIAEVVNLYASNPDHCRAAGEYNPEHLDADRIEADLRKEADTDGCEVLLARDTQGQLNALLCLLDRHPADGLPWIGLLLIHGRLHRKGVGRLLAGTVEERFRSDGRGSIRLAVLENTPSALAFWTSLGWHETDRRTDRQHGRPCIVMDKHLL